MIKENRRVITDMDGTLYKFDKGQATAFHKSRFFKDVRERSRGLLVATGMSPEQAVSEYDRIRSAYNRQVSLGFEAEHGIDRYRFFSQTWGQLEPGEYIEADRRLPDAMGELQGKIALLTAAPRVWAVKVLAHLQLEDIFGERLYTGEPDLRKPNQQLIRNIVSDFGSESGDVFAIGDEETSDIAPANAVGIKTIKVGPGETSANYQVDDMFTALQISQR